MSAPVHVFIMMDSGETSRVMEFQTEGRSAELPSGGVWLTTGLRWLREPSVKNIEDEIAKSCPRVDASGQPLPQPVSYHIIDRSELPTDRTYRDAWVHDGRDVVQDLEKAKAIHLDRLRQQRVVLFTGLDAEWMKAEGQKDTTTADAVEAERQKLRDLPSLDAVTSIEELKAVRLDVAEVAGEVRVGK